MIVRQKSQKKGTIMSARMGFARFLHDSEHYDCGLAHLSTVDAVHRTTIVGSPPSSTAKTVSRDARNWQLCTIGKPSVSQVVLPAGRLQGFYRHFVARAPLQGKCDSYIQV